MCRIRSSEGQAVVCRLQPHSWQTSQPGEWQRQEFFGMQSEKNKWLKEGCEFGLSLDTQEEKMGFFPGVCWPQSASANLGEEVARLVKPRYVWCVLSHPSTRNPESLGLKVPQSSSQPRPALCRDTSPARAAPSPCCCLETAAGGQQNCHFQTLEQPFSPKVTLSGQELLLSFVWNQTGHYLAKICSGNVFFWGVFFVMERKSLHRYDCTNNCQNNWTKLGVIWQRFA